jgi:LmbE family N-acetylglucosaminyl deacetylase
MEDHTNTSRLSVTAAFARGMPNWPVDPPCNAVNNNVTVYHAQPYGNHDPLGRPVTPTMFVDTTRVIERKVEALALHRSQKQFLDATQGVDSYLQTLRDLDAEVGRMSGAFQYAEGWRKHRHQGFCGEHDDPLRDVLSDNMRVA